MDFWVDDEEYDEVLEQWEWSIVNDQANYIDEALPQFDKAEIYNYSYEQLLELYNNQQTADRIWNEIIFCRLMHQLRPEQWEKSDNSKVKKY